MKRLAGRPRSINFRPTLWTTRQSRLLAFRRMTRMIEMDRIPLYPLFPTPNPSDNTLLTHLTIWTIVSRPTVGLVR